MRRKGKGHPHFQRLLTVYYFQEAGIGLKKGMPVWGIDKEAQANTNKEARVKRFFWVSLLSLSFYTHLWCISRCGCECKFEL